MDILLDRLDYFYEEEHDDPTGIMNNRKELTQVDVEYIVRVSDKHELEGCMEMSGRHFKSFNSHDEIIDYIATNLKTLVTQLTHRGEGGVYNG